MRAHFSLLDIEIYLTHTQHTMFQSEWNRLSSIRMLEFRRSSKTDEFVAFATWIINSTLGSVLKESREEEEAMILGWHSFWVNGIEVSPEGRYSVYLCVCVCVSCTSAHVKSNVIGQIPLQQILNETNAKPRTFLTEQIVVTNAILSLVFADKFVSQFFSKEL